MCKTIQTNWWINESQKLKKWWTRNFFIDYKQSSFRHVRKSFRTWRVPDKHNIFSTILSYSNFHTYEVPLRLHEISEMNITLQFNSKTSNADINTVNEILKLSNNLTLTKNVFHRCGFYSNLVLKTQLWKCKLKHFRYRSLETIDMRVDWIDVSIFNCFEKLNFYFWFEKWWEELMKQVKVKK